VVIRRPLRSWIVGVLGAGIAAIGILVAVAVTMAVVATVTAARWCGGRPSSRELIGHLSCSCQTGATLPRVTALQSCGTRYPPYLARIGWSRCDLRPGRRSGRYGHCKIEVGRSGGLADLAASGGVDMPVHVRVRGPCGLAPRAESASGHGRRRASCLVGTSGGALWETLSGRAR